MKRYSSDEIDQKLKARLGFFKGLWLSLVIAWRFLVSLGPQNWDIIKLTNAGRVDPLEGGQRSSASEVNVAPIDPDETRK